MKGFIKKIGVTMILLFVSMSFFSQNKMNKYNSPVNQNNIGECPSCIEMLLIDDTNNILELVKECSNIRVLILKNTSIDSLPAYFSGFKKLEKIILENIQSVPLNLEIVDNLKSLDLIRCQNLKLDSVFFKSISLKNLKLWGCKNLNLSYISSSIILFAENKMDWNNLKEITIDNCKEINIYQSDYNIVYDLNFRNQLKKIHFEMCGKVLIEDKFYEKVKQIKSIEINR